jgi:hypothetical protein
LVQREPKVGGVAEARGVGNIFHGQIGAP